MDDQNRFNFKVSKDSSPEEILLETRNLRFDMVKSMTEHGAPQGREVRQVMDLLNDIDNQTLTSQKLEQEKTQANNENDIARMAIEVARQTGTSITNSTVINGEYKEVNPKELPDVKLLPGEMSTDIVEATFEDFIALHGED